MPPALHDGWRIADTQKESSAALVERLRGGVDVAEIDVSIEHDEPKALLLAILLLVDVDFI